MLSNVIVLVGGYLAPLVAIGVGVVFVRPAIARVEIERAALRIKDSIESAILDGQIDAGNPRALDTLHFCDLLCMHAEHFTFGESGVANFALRRISLDPAGYTERRREASAENAAGLATADGERCLDDAEKDLDKALSAYFLRGSALWWILTPVDWVKRLGRRVNRSAHVGVHAADGSPSAAAAPSASAEAAAVARGSAQEFEAEPRGESEADRDRPWWVTRAATIGEVEYLDLNDLAIAV